MVDPTASDSLPLPAEIASLGTPERVFTPGTGKAPPLAGSVLAVSIGLGGVAFWACAAVLMGWIVLGGNPPPREAALFGGLPCMLLGTAALLWAAWDLLGGSIKNQAYALFPQALVELHPRRHRVIRWEDLGIPVTTKVAGQTAYRAAVRGAAPLYFDYTLPEHEALRRAISARHFLVALGGDERLLSLPVAVPARHFLAQHWGPMGVPLATYRVSRVGDFALLLRVGDGVSDDPQGSAAKNPALAFGGVGGALAGLREFVDQNKYEQFQKNMQRVEGASERELLDHAADLDGSFVVSAAKVQLAPPASWQQLGGCSIAGRLQLDHSGEAPRVLELLRTADLATAKELLGTAPSPAAATI